MADWLLEVRFAVRALRKRPAFTAVAVLTLALGIGAASAIFTVVDAILIQPLPYPDAGRLVELHIRGSDGETYPLPDSDFLAWRAQSDAFEAVAVYDGGQGLSLTGEGRAERVIARNVTGGFFAALGVAPALGRLLALDSDRPGAPATAVLSHAFWLRRYHGDPQIVGRTIVLDGVPHTVVGVMPASFVFLRPDVDVWRPLTMKPPPRRGPFYTWGLGRLKRGVPIQHAAASIERVEDTIKRQHHGANEWHYALVPLKQEIVGDTGRILYLLFGAVGLLLLISTANVANLLLARGASREREIAVRGALGASRGRIVAQLILESVLLGLMAAAAGLAIGAVSTRTMLSLAPRDIPRIHEVGMNLSVFAFAFACAGLTAVLFGLAPAVRAARTPLVESLKAGGRGAAGSVSHRKLQRAVVVAELALALMLSIGAGLLIRSLSALARVEPGFAPDHLLTLQLSLPAARYDTGQKVAAFYDSLEARLNAVPAVRSVATSVSLPPDMNAMTDNFTPEGQALPPNQSGPVAPLLFVDDAYFTTLGVRVVAGRVFDESDTIDKPPVVIINETMARRYFGGVDAVGRRLKEGGPERPRNPFMEIVGVVADVKYDGLAAPAEPAFYLDFRQNPQSRRFIVLRTAGDPHAVVNAVRSAIASADPDLAPAGVSTMDELLATSIAPPRFRTALVSIFAVTGLLLAAIGVYGVMAYAVAERTHELGVRIALGASRADVSRLVLGDGAVLAALGVGLGLAGSVALTRLIATLLFGVTPTDAATFAAVAALLAATALAGSWLPARRATRVDPMVALRHE